ncbi:hypothetical protein BvCmsKSNP041_04781 [Escherichia coli]|nr:hypothetical protein BvCmsB22A_04739 [Escherichia coli]GDJ34274.1 hypothetical protein BvCmsKSNP041_04781 [Escherichia coli]GDS57492.1 hypothetical protein BvCmsSINP013_02940 [Escherichia coli]
MFIGGDSGATRELIRQVNRAGGPETLMKIKGLIQLSVYLLTPRVACIPISHVW